MKAKSLFRDITSKALLAYTLLAPFSVSAEEIRDSGSIPTLGGSACNLIYTPSDATWRINRFGLDENLNDSTTLFTTQSNASIQSVACDVAGENAYFAYRAYDDDDFEIYQLALNEEGASPTSLTNNAVDDTNVSISADGSVIAWQTELDDGRQAVVIDEHFEDGSTESRTLSSANHYLQPSLSQNGKWLSLVQRRSGSDLVFKYHLADATFTRLSKVPRRKGAYNPSINNDGDKVAWVEGKGKNALILHTVGMTPARKTILSNANGIGHPFLADNGSMVIYSIIRDRKSFTYVYDMEKSQQYRLGDTLRGEYYSGTTWPTANRNDLCDMAPLEFSDESTEYQVSAVNFQVLPSCASKQRVDKGDHYAKYFTLELDTAKIVDFWIKLNRNYVDGAPHLIITKGLDGQGEVVTSIAASTEAPRIPVESSNILEPGQYTIEITSPDRFVENAIYDMEVTLLEPDLSSDCPMTNINHLYAQHFTYSTITTFDDAITSTWTPGAYDTCHSGDSIGGSTYTKYYTFEQTLDKPLKISVSGQESEAAKITVLSGNGIDGTVIAEAYEELLSPLLPLGYYTVAIELAKQDLTLTNLTVNFRTMISSNNITSCWPGTIELEDEVIYRRYLETYRNCSLRSEALRQYQFTLDQSKNFNLSLEYGTSFKELRIIRGGLKDGEVIEIINGNLAWEGVLEAGEYGLEVVGESIYGEDSDYLIISTETVSN